MHDLIPTISDFMALLAQDGLTDTDDQTLNIKDVMLLFGLSLITVGLMLRAIKRRKKGNTTPKASEMLEKNRQLNGVKTDLDDLMVEIQQMAHRLGSQLDNKAARLEKLIEEADQKAHLLQQTHRPHTTDSPSASENANAALPQDPLSLEVYQLTKQGYTPEQIAKKLDQHIGKIELILALAK